MRIGYFADGPWSHRALERILADDAIDVAFVCARFDRADPVLRRMAGDAGVEFLLEEDINRPEFVARLRAFRCDLLVSMSFNQIFRRDVRELAPRGTINCHAGKLPFYRGRNILNWALINDEREFGITVHHVDAGVDTGDIILQRTYPITDADDYGTLLEIAYAGCAAVLYDALTAIRLGRATRTPQANIHPTGFYCVQRRDGDERLDWNQPSRAVFNFIRAVCRPGPEARTSLGDADLRINRARLVPEAPVYRGVPGAVVRVESDGFTVKTADSFVKVLEWSGAPKVRVGDRLR